MNDGANMAQRCEREIPEGYEARIEGNKVIIELKETESEEERIRKELIKFISEVKRISENGRETWAVRKSDANMCAAFLSYLEKLKEQKPILEVFGFKVGDAVRLKDGDGRKHIIKSFEEVEGIHGPNFYQVEFEDNSARDGIYPGEEYPNGYYTQMEKFEEERKPSEWGEDERIRKAVCRIIEQTNLIDWNYTKEQMLAWLKKQKEEEGYEAIPVESTLEYKLGFKAGQKKMKEDIEKGFGINEHSLDYLAGRYAGYTAAKEEQKPLTVEDVVEQSKRFGREVEVLHKDEQKPVEWGEVETKLLESIIDDYEKAAISFCGYDGKIGFLKAIRNGEYNLPKQEWSEEDESRLSHVITTLAENVKRGSAREDFEFLASLPRRFNLQPKTEWSEEDKAFLQRTISVIGWAGCCTAKYRIINTDGAAELQSWLEGLPNRFSLQPHWKPSEEQMEALRVVLEHEAKRMGSSYELSLANSLYEQLKAL